MSCACEHRKLGQELDRIRRLAKAYAKMEDVIVIIIKNPDGTYGFCPEASETDKDIVEYITPY